MLQAYVSRQLVLDDGVCGPPSDCIRRLWRGPHIGLNLLLSGQVCGIGGRRTPRDRDVTHGKGSAKADYKEMLEHPAEPCSLYQRVSPGASHPRPLHGPVLRCYDSKIQSHEQKANLTFRYRPRASQHVQTTMIFDTSAVEMCPALRNPQSSGEWGARVSVLWGTPRQCLMGYSTSSA